MCIFLCMGGNSTTWMNTAILVTCIRNFRKNRGPVSGILKGYVGLSTAIFTDLCSALFADDPAKFLLMLAIILLIVCVAAIFFLREIPPSSTSVEEKAEAKYLGIIRTCSCYCLVLYSAYYDLFLVCIRIIQACSNFVFGLFRRVLIYFSDYSDFKFVSFLF
ncbi:hypothetical protein LIER_21619 [Lithospermum erythrorhizon]|uniref:Nodulin-like domain-containing protein n=1 Tax=Lithospermum erythrorhizon TaxID=34254 RepID=A0AAV3QV20_LITER